MYEWPKYATQRPSAIQVDIWSNDWPDAGICMPMGGDSGLLGIDIDTDRPDIVAALEAELGVCYVTHRREKRGYCAFVRAPEGFELEQNRGTSAVCACLIFCGPAGRS